MREQLDCIELRNYRESYRVYIPVVHGLCIDKYYTRLFHHIPICSQCTFHIRSYLEMCLQRASACVKHVPCL